MISHVTRRFTAFLVTAMAMPSFVPTVSAVELNKLRCEYRSDPLEIDAIYAIGSGTYRFQSTPPEPVKGADK